MERYNITMTQTRVATFTIEAHSEHEAVDLVSNRIKDDDYFCDEIEEMYENGVDSETINAKPAGTNEYIDYTYADMIGNNEEEEN